MPKFVIERQYLVPMYQHIVVEAETLEKACETAASDDIAWDSQEMDSDKARATTITEAKMLQRADIVSVGKTMRREISRRGCANTHDLVQRLSYSSWRRHQAPVSLRPLGARSSHWYMPQSPSSPHA